MKTLTFGKKVRILLFSFIILSLSLSSIFSSNTDADTDRPLVYVIEVEDTIEQGLFVFMQRAFREAEEERADHIILHMNTFGGAVKAADDIGKLLQDTRTPITVFVNNSAISAGAYIALNADTIIMAPTATIGAATVVDMEGNIGDAKAMSRWIRAMRGAASANDRDPLYAEAMVDPDMKIEGLTSKGSPLTFSADEALEHGYAEEITDSIDGVFDYLGFENPIVVEVELTFAERVARFITNPIVVSILLSLASLGLILELYSPGFGVPGAIGLSSLFLFFFGHMIAGFAGWESLILFGVGAAFIVLEIFTAGFGLFGILGILSVLTSLTLASADVVTGLRSIGISAVVTVVVLFFLGKYLNKKGFWHKLVLQEDLSAEEGKILQEKRSELIGQEGITLNMLRPSGVIRIGDQEYDVVSNGRPISKEAKVKVIKVEGTRIVVSEVQKEEDQD